MNFKMALSGAVVASLVGVFALVGCGKNDCEAAADDMAAKMEECKITATTGTTTGDSTSAECTEAAGTLAKCLAACYTAASCDTITGKGKPEDTKAYGECTTKCTAAK